MARVFISYRHDDTAELAGRIGDRLAAQLGARNVFVGPSRIPPGANVRSYLAWQAGQIDVLIVLIGQRWLSPVPGMDWAPIYDPNDMMRLEIEAALTAQPRRPLVLPLLVHGAGMPEARLLPPSLQSLPYVQALTVRPDPDFSGDLARVVETIKKYSATTAQPATSHRFLGRHPWLRAFTVLLCVSAVLVVIANGLHSPDDHGPAYVAEMTFAFVFVFMMPVAVISSWVVAVRVRAFRWLIALVISAICLVLAFVLGSEPGSRASSQTDPRSVVAGVLALLGLVSPLLFSLSLR